MISPKQASELAAQNADAAAKGPAAAASTLEPMIDPTLVFYGRASVSSSTAPPPGALHATAQVIAELERRYGAAGWMTTRYGGTLVIEAPVQAVGLLAGSRLDPWQCRSCGTVHRAGDHCGSCKAPRY